MTGLETATRLSRIVVGIQSLIALADFMFGAVFVNFLLGLPLTPATLGLLLSISTGTSMVLEAPTGVLSDRFGHKRFAVTGFGLWASGIGVIAFSTNAVMAGIGLVMWTTGQAMQSGALFPIVIRGLSEDSKQQIIKFLVHRGQVFKWIMSAAGAGLVILLGSSWNARIILAICAIALYLVMLATIVFLPSDKGNTQREIRLRSVLKKTFGWSIRRENLPLVLISMASSCTLTLIVVTWQPALTHEGRNLSINGLILLAFTMMAALGSYFSKHVPAGIWGAAGSILGVALVLSVGISFGFTVRFLSYCLAELIIGAMFVAVATWQQSAFPDEIRNSAFSTLSSAGLFAAILSNYMLGKVWQMASLDTAVHMVSGIVVVFTVLGVILSATLEKRGYAKHT